MSTIQSQQSERIDIHTTTAAKQLIQQAAAASHKSVSEFLLDHGLIAAEKTLADRHLFVLTPEQWQKFQNILEQPSQPKPKLEKLLTELGVFD